MAYDLLNEIRRSIALERLQGLADAGLSVYSSGLADLGGGLAYLPAAAIGGDEAGQYVKQATQDALTYQPRTDAGQGYMQALGKLMQPVADVASKAGEGFADAIYQDTQSPAIGALATAAPQALAEFAGRFSGMQTRRYSTSASISAASRLESLKSEVRSLIGEPKSDDEWRAAFYSLTPDQRQRLNELEGVEIPAAERAAKQPAESKKKPSEDALRAEYESPSDVPPEVMAYVRKGSPITQDATDAVRWSRIVGTQNEPRLWQEQVTLYRAVDGDVIRPGDWVTTNRKYAEDHLRKNLKGKGKVVSLSVSGQDVLLGPTGDADELFYAPLELSAPYQPRQ